MVVEQRGQARLVVTATMLADAGKRELAAERTKDWERTAGAGVAIPSAARIYGEASGAFEHRRRQNGINPPNPSTAKRMLEGSGTALGWYKKLSSCSDAFR